MSSPTVILITGANSGIGYAAAKVIAAASDKYNVIVASRSPEKGRNAVNQLQAEDKNIKATLSNIQLDVTDQASVDAAYTEIEKRHGKLDVLINNAGVANQDPSFIKQLQTDLATNVVGAARVSETFKPLLLKSQNPYLIHVGSVQGSASMSEKLQMADWKSYSMSKSAILMLAYKDATEARQQNSKLKVFGSCPGFVVSNLRGTSEEQRSGWGTCR